jgi:hypothetical protein
VRRASEKLGIHQSEVVNRILRQHFNKA